MTNRIREDLHDGISLYRGDAVEVLGTFDDGSIDAVVTDPPYGTDSEPDGYGRRELGGPSKRIAGDEDLSCFARVLPHLYRVLKNNSWLVCFASPKRHYESVGVIQDAGFGICGELVWDKTMPGLGGGLRYQHELIVLATKGKPVGHSAIVSVIREMRVRLRKPWHPHEKPVDLMRKLVRYASVGADVVLDPFAGSGSTPVACLHEGRLCVSIEVDDGHCETIRSRVLSAQGVTPYSLFPTTV